MAFNVDVEMGRSPDDPKKYRFYCATMTNVWNIDRSPNEFDVFVDGMKRSKTIDKTVPLPKKPGKHDEEKVEAFVSRLGCTPSSLRWEGFHVFVGIPEALRYGGLKYVKHRPFGKVLKEGMLQVPPRFVQRKPRTRYVQLTKEGRSSYVVVYLGKGESYPMAFFKMSSGTKFSKVDAIPHSFAFQVGKRQWVFIAAGQKDFKQWASKCIEMLDDHGVKVKGFEEGPTSGFKRLGKSFKHSMDLKIPGGALTKRDTGQRLAKKRKKYEKAKVKNTALREAIVAKRHEQEELSRTIEEWQRKKDALRSGEVELRRKKEEELREEMEVIEERHTDKMEKLRRYLEILHKKVEEHSRKDGGGDYKVGALFTDKGYKHGDVQTGESGGPAADESDEDAKDSDESESSTPKDKGIDENGFVTDVHPEETQGNTDEYVYTYRNAHKHDHVHVLLHKHTHFHDHTVEPDVVWTQTQTLAHTIVHTQTQFQIKKTTLQL